MAYVKTEDGVKIYYEECGKGTPLVLAYGIGGNSDMWDVNVPVLSSQHRLILWEPRGHGRSGSPKDPAKYSFPKPGWKHFRKQRGHHLRILQQQQDRQRNGNVLTDNIESLALTYTPKDGSTTQAPTDLSNIRKVTMTLIVRSSTIDPLTSDYRRLELTSDITPRNMNL